MLLSLSVRNYAIIDRISIDFSNGLNVLTGETGAGKSIIVGAFSLALGYRSDTDSIRMGEDKLNVQALFSLDKINENLKIVLDENAISYEDNSLLLSREVNRSGKNICKVNDTLVNVGLLKVIGSYLVDIHGQHEHQKLLNSQTHLELLDSYKKQEIAFNKREVELAYFALKKANEEYKNIFKLSKEEKEKKEDYEKKLKEIDDVKLEVGLDEELEKRSNILSNSQKIYEQIDLAYSSLYEGSSNVLETLLLAENALSTACRYDEKISKDESLIKEAKISIEEAIYSLREYKMSLEFEPEELDEIQGKLYRINNLKRKFGETVSDILNVKEDLSNKLSLINNMDFEIEKAKEKFLKAKEDYLNKAFKLREIRKEVAKDFEQQITNKLNLLSMPNVSFKVDFEKLEENEKFTVNGIDKVSFLISTNKGQDLKPLSKIASGGEISRIMLAFKTILANVDDTSTLIFDEIDTGISGRTAQIVSEQLYLLSKNHQVICITHLPQIASMANKHYLIKKEDKVNLTTTSFSALNEEEKEVELARMLGGVEITDLTLSHAKEMLNLAKNFKKN